MKGQTIIAEKNHAESSKSASDKIALLHSLLEVGLDANNMANYQPLTFLSQLMEQTMPEQHMKIRPIYLCSLIFYRVCSTQSIQ